MSTTIILAKLFAVVYVVVGIGMLLNRNYYRKCLPKMLKAPGVLYFGGIVALVSGFFIVSYHSRWSSGAEILVSLFGWLAIVKGASFLLFPERAMAWAQGMLRNERFSTLMPVSAISLGLVFSYFGFF